MVVAVAIDLHCWEDCLRVSQKRFAGTVIRLEAMMGCCTGEKEVPYDGKAVCSEVLQLRRKMPAKHLDINQNLDCYFVTGPFTQS